MFTYNSCTINYMYYIIHVYTYLYIYYTMLQCISAYMNIMRENAKPIPTYGASIRKAGSYNSPEETMLHQAW